MKWILALMLACGLALGCGAAESSAEGDGAADAEAIIAGYVEALGGLENIRALDTVRKSGTYVYNGLEHPFERYEKRGGRCREEIEGLSMYGTSKTAGEMAIRSYDGENAWIGTHADELMTAPMPEDMLEGFLIDADLESPLVGYREKGHSVELVGPTEVEGTPVIELALTLADGSAQKWYLDSETHLPVMKAAAEKPEGFLAAQTWFFDDYREVAGVKMPFFVMIEEKLFAREYLIDEVEVNVEVEDAVFVEPEGTRAEGGGQG